MYVYLFATGRGTYIGESNYKAPSTLLGERWRVYWVFIVNEHWQHLNVKWPEYLIINIIVIVRIIAKLSE